MSVIKPPSGIVTGPLNLMEGDFTLSLNTANVETEIARKAVPRNTSWSFKQGDPIYMYLATSAPAQITTGTVRVYLSDPNEITKMLILEEDVSVLSASRTDETQKARWPYGWSRQSDELVIVTLNSASAAATAGTKISFKGTQFCKT